MEKSEKQPSVFGGKSLFTAMLEMQRIGCLWCPAVESGKTLSELRTSVCPSCPALWKRIYEIQRANSR